MGYWSGEVMGYWSYVTHVSDPLSFEKGHCFLPNYTAFIVGEDITSLRV